MCDARLWRDVRLDAQVVHADLTQDDRVEAMASRALRGAPDRFIAVGFSMGGIVALQLAASTPDRLAGLVLADTNAFADLPERTEARVRQQSEVRSGKLERVVADELKPNYLAAANRGRLDILDLTMRMALDLGPEVFVRQSEALRVRPDMRSRLGDVKCPVLVICGAEDVLCPPAWHADIAAALPSATLRVVNDAGHLLPLEQPETLSREIAQWAHTFCKEAPCM